MEVTPQLLNEVEFREARKGYDTRDVDDFLERLGAAIGQLQERVDAAEARATDAEAKIAEAEARTADAEAKVADAEERLREASSSEETLRRTLVLAQRTADAAIKEAEETAARTIASAQEQADRLVSEAHAEVERARTEGENEVRRAVESTRVQLDNEIRALEETRDALRRDAEVLERHVGEQRERVRAAVGELQRLLDDPDSLRVTPAPASSDVPVPETAPETGPGAEAEAPDASVAEVADELPGEEEPEPEADRVVDLDGPPTEAIERLDIGDDAYLAELRKAMTDDSPLGPREEAEIPVFTPQDAAAFFEPDQDDAPRPRPRFGRRR